MRKSPRSGGPKMTTKLDELMAKAKNAIDAVRDCDAPAKVRGDALEDLQFYAMDIALKIEDDEDEDEEDE